VTGATRARRVAEIDGDDIIADLEALVAALDRRVPRIERAGERQIAQDAAALRRQALERLETLRRGRCRGEALAGRHEEM
jgi:hypothetical protein